MIEQQYEVELEYGRQNIRNVVLGEIDTESPVFMDLVGRIDSYRGKEYGYESKNRRIKELKVPSDEIALELTIAVITIEQVVTPIQVVISKMIPHLKYKNIVDGIKTAAEILAVCEGKLYSLHHSSDYENDTNTLGIKPHMEVSSKTRSFINNTKYLPPMLCKPIDWIDSKNGGHLTGSKSIILGSNNEAGQKVSLDVINILQSIEWELNEEILEFEEVSKKELDTGEKLSNFKRIVSSSEKVYQELLEQGNKFYFVWKYDYRGRMYSQGYHVNLQGNSIRKAMLNFKQKELITDEVIV